VATSASKSFNIPALTGSYGLIGDDRLQADLVGVEKLAIMPGTTYGSIGHLRLNGGCPRSSSSAVSTG